MLTEKEIEIIEGCQKGESSSQKMLYDTYGPLIKGICMRYTENLEEAEGLFHDVFIFILTHFEQYNKITSLGGWLRQITVNKAIDYVNMTASRWRCCWGLSTNSRRTIGPSLTCMLSTISVRIGLQKR